jgi:hypothetical protein
MIAAMDQSCRLEIQALGWLEHSLPQVSVSQAPPETMEPLQYDLPPIQGLDLIRECPPVRNQGCYLVPQGSNVRLVRCGKPQLFHEPLLLKQCSHLS